MINGENMQEKEIFKMNEKDEKLLNLLSNIGYSIPESKVIVYLSNFKSSKSRDIETAMQLSQPEVSIAIKNISDLIEVDKTYKKARGRPVYIYKLKKDMHETVKNKADEKIKKTKENIDKLKNLLKDMKQWFKKTYKFINYIRH